MFRHVSLLVLLTALSACTSVPARKTASTDVEAKAAQLPAQLPTMTAQNGSVIRIKIPVADVLRVTFEGKEIPFFPTDHGSDHQFEAWLGIPYEHEAGQTSVTIVAGKVDEPQTYVLPLTVRAGKFATQTLRVDPNKVELNPENQARVDRETEEVKAIYAKVAPEKRWTIPFRVPINTVITAVYGLKRVFNGKPMGYHNGVDFRARVPTRIRAAAPGVVVMVKDLFISGHTVILDHGYGVFTAYCHLSEFRVKEGDSVKRGEVVGISGATGRATGPHLHWTATVNQVYVNPIDLTRFSANYE